MNSLFAQNILSGGIKVAGAGLTFLMFLALARALGPEEYGRFATMFSLGNFLAFVALLGQQTRVLKHLPGWIDAAQFGLVKRMLRQALSTTVACCATICAFLYLCTFVLPAPEATVILLGAIPFILPFALGELFASLLRVFGAISGALLPRDILWRLTVVMLTSSAGLGLLRDMSAISAMNVVSGTLMVLVLGQILLFHRVAPAQIWRAPEKPLETGFVQDSLWFWVATVVGIMAGHLSVVFTSVSLPDADTGAFFAAAKVAQLLNLPLMAVNIVAAPRVSRMFAKRDMAGIRDICRAVSPLLLMSSLAGMAVLLVMPGWILALFDPAFRAATPALVLLAAGQLFSALCGPVGTLMLMADGERRFLLLIGLSEGAALLLILLLSPSFGITGAASAALIGKLGWNALAVLWCRQKLGVDPTVLGLLRRPRK